MLEIKNRYGDVIFSRDCEDNSIRKTIEEAARQKSNLSEADLRCADLRWANLRWADLRGADLSEADLRWADLRWADLRWANLRGATGNGIEIMSFVSHQYSGCYTSDTMWIGCRRHAIATWWEDSDNESHTFTSGQKQWREKNRGWITEMVKQNPAKPTGAKQC